MGNMLKQVNAIGRSVDAIDSIMLQQKQNKTIDIAKVNAAIVVSTCSISGDV